MILRLLYKKKVAAPPRRQHSYAYTLPYPIRLSSMHNSTFSAIKFGDRWAEPAMQIS